MSGDAKRPIPPELLELATLYALDALVGPEREELELELQANPALQAEVDELREAAASLGAAINPVEPPPALRDRLMAKAMPGGPARPEVLLAEDGLLILRPEQMQWQPHPLEGLSVRVLHLDRATGRMSSIVRFKAGSVYPGHRHAVAEELFVLEGRVEVNGIPMGPGDYCRAEAGSVHKPAFAVTDAVILVRNSVRDEYQ